jgi:hypothetical protein
MNFRPRMLAMGRREWDPGSTDTRSGSTDAKPESEKIRNVSVERRPAPVPDLFDRLAGTRAELDHRITVAAERAMRLRLERREAEAVEAMRAMCDALDVTIEAITALSILEG